jgi:hypothetical protein
MKEAIERLREAVEQEDAIAKGVRVVVAELFLELGPRAFWAVAREFMGMQGKVIFPDEFYRDEIAAIQRERAATPHIHEEAPCVGEFITPDQIVAAPNGTCVYHATDPQDCARKIDGQWIHASGRNIALRGDKWVLQRWGHRDETAETEHLERFVAARKAARDPSPTPASRPTGVLTAEQANALGDGWMVMRASAGLVVAEKWNGAWTITDMIGGGRLETSKLNGGPWLLLRRVDHE